MPYVVPGKILNIVDDVVMGTCYFFGAEAAGRRVRRPRDIDARLLQHLKIGLYSGNDTGVHGAGLVLPVAELLILHGALRIGLKSLVLPIQPIGPFRRVEVEPGVPERRVVARKLELRAVRPAVLRAFLRRQVELVQSSSNASPMTGSGRRTAWAARVRRGRSCRRCSLGVLPGA